MDRRPLKIMIVSSHLKAMGGAEKNVLDLCRGFRGRCDVEVAGLQCGALLENVRAAGAVAHDLSVKSLLSFKALSAFFWLRKKLKAERFDVVLTYHHDADFLAGLAALSAGVPAVSSRRDMGFMLTGAHVWIYRFFNRAFARIIAVAEAVRQEIVRTQWAPRPLITVVHNGIVSLPTDVDEAAVRAELGLHPSRRIVGMVANFRPVKGQEFFAKAAEEVARVRDDVQFVVIGNRESDYFHTVRDMIAAAGLEDRFHFVGDRADVGRLLPAFDIFVLSSRLEGFSNALIEAMSAGVPPVASAVGGNPEAIHHGRNGFLFAAGDHRALARHLTTLLGDDELRERMGAAAAATVAGRFSFDGMIDRVHEVLLEAVGERAVEAIVGPVPMRAAGEKR